jgi:hypothetical protein
MQLVRPLDSMFQSIISLSSPPPPLCMNPILLCLYSHSRSHSHSHSSCSLKIQDGAKDGELGAASSSGARSLGQYSRYVCVYECAGWGAGGQLPHPLSLV